MQQNLKSMSPSSLLKKTAVLIMLSNEDIWKKLNVIIEKPGFPMQMYKY